MSKIFEKTYKVGQGISKNEDRFKSPLKKITQVAEKYGFEKPK